jgi:hypothetical protein
MVEDVQLHGVIKESDSLCSSPCPHLEEEQGFVHLHGLQETE